MFKVIDKTDHREWHVGAIHNNNVINKILINATDNHVLFMYQNSAIQDVTSQVILLPEIDKNLFKYDYVVTKDKELTLVDCNTIYDKQSSRVVGNKYFNPELNIIFCNNKIYDYDKFNHMNMLIYKDNFTDNLFVIVFSDDEVYLYIAYEFFSDNQAKPIATLNNFHFKIPNQNLKIKQNIINEYTVISKLPLLKRKSIAYEMVTSFQSLAKEYVYELNISPVDLLEYLLQFKGYFRTFTESNLKLTSYFKNEVPILITTKYKSLMNSFSCDYHEIESISKQIKD